MFDRLTGSLVFAALALACSRNPAPPPPTPPTQAEAEKFAAAYVIAKVPCDVAKMKTLVDIDLILTRAIQNTSYPKDMVAGMRRGLDPQQVLCNSILGANQAIRYLRTQVVDGSPQPLFRLTGDAGYTYERLELDKRGDAVVAADLFNYASGLPYSLVFRNVIAALSTNADKFNTGLLKQMNSQRAEGKWAEAHDTFKSLPESLRTTREVMVIEVMTTMNLDEATAIDALDRFTKAFPADPAMLLIEIDMHALHKKPEKQLAAIERLDRNIGGDPYLDTLRADAYLTMGKLDDALAAAKRAAANDPKLASIWWQVVALQTASAKFADATATLTTLRTLEKVDRARLAQDERYAPLIASAEFAEWERAK